MKELLKKFGLAFAIPIAMFVLMAAATQIDLTSQVQGILPIGNGGTGQTSFAAGVVRSSGTALSSAELSGDATTSGSNVVTVAKVNGTSVPTNSASNQIVVTTASATGGWETLPSCTSGALQYNNTTQTFSCGTVLTGSFADNETPTGTCPTTTLTLANSPSPVGSLDLYKNGQLLTAGGADFTLAGATVTLTTSCSTSDVFRASYRY